MTYIFDRILMHHEYIPLYIHLNYDIVLLFTKHSIVKFYQNLYYSIIKYITIILPIYANILCIIINMISFYIQ